MDIYRATGAVGDGHCRHICSETVSPVVDIKCPHCHRNNNNSYSHIGSVEQTQVLISPPAAARQRSSAAVEQQQQQHIVLFNPFSMHAVIFQQPPQPVAVSFVGPGLVMMLNQRRLPEDDDANRGGKLPARKEAVEAMQRVKVGERSSCSVCLVDMEAGEEAREMPCHHRFHGGCILPWLEFHSSCPVCRFQLPVEGEVKESLNNGRSFWRLPMIPSWPFTVFSSSSA